MLGLKRLGVAVNLKQGGSSRGFPKFRGPFHVFMASLHNSLQHFGVYIGLRRDVGWEVVAKRRSLPCWRPYKKGFSILGSTERA